MKALLIIAVLTVSACAPVVVAGIAGITGVALTTNEPAVKEFGDKYLSNKEGK